MSKGKKRAPKDASRQPPEKKIKVQEAYQTLAMSLQCAECKGNIANSEAGAKLSFLADGPSLHLVMSMSLEGRAGTGFTVKNVVEGKRPTESNPYASLAHVLCGNMRGGKTCSKKVGGVKCYPPLSDNRLIFFQHKALLVDEINVKNWKAVKDTYLSKVKLMPPSKEDIEREFKPRKRPPLVRFVGNQKEASAPEVGLTKSYPRPYQIELFRIVTECERNSLVYLPTGLGKTLVAAMVLRHLLELNPERQAYFVVETSALAMQQTAELQKEIRCAVEMMVGSSLVPPGGIGGKNDYAKRKLDDLRAARVVVATAGAFEHALLKRYIDPDVICCVVLDEAHHCCKEHPFNRLAKAFLVSRPEISESPASSKPASELPKVVALTASPAGEKTVHETVIRIEELLDRLGADLAAPADTLQEVKDCTPLVNLELVSVRATAPENLLLIFLEKIVLRRVAKLAPGSDAGVEAERLLNTVDTRAKGAAEAAAALAGSSATPPCDDSSRFPNKAYVALCQRALHSARGSVSWEEGSAEGEIGAEGSRDDESRFQLVDLVNLAFAVDEIGGEATWRWVLDALEDEKKGTGGEGEDDEKGPEDDDPDREGAVHLLKAYLPAETSNEELDCEAGAPGRAGTPSMVGGTAGSKLEKIAALLLEYKERCDEAGSVFSALVFVSTRDLATATPGMLEAVPTLQPFVKAQHIVGLSEMTLSEQRAALESFKTGPANVLVSTSVCGEGIEVPACALVVCASLPSSGTELVQLRGRIRCEENSRFLGLSRSCRIGDEEHVKTICLRESNMLVAIERLTGGGGSNSGDTALSSVTSRYTSDATAEHASSSTVAARGGRQEAGPGTGILSYSPVKIPPATRPTAPAAGSPDKGNASSTRSPAKSTSAVSNPPTPDVVPVKAPGESWKGVAEPEAGVGALAAAEQGTADPECAAGVVVPAVSGTTPVGTVQGAKGWKNVLPPTLSPPARKYAASFLATCARQSLQRNPNQMARCTVNTAAQLAHTIKPVFEFEEVKLGGPAHESVFESRCIVWSKLEELAGLIVVKEAKGASIKAAREAAAAKVVQYLLSKENSKLQGVGSST